MNESLNREQPGEDAICYICGQPAGGGEMLNGAHLLCAWGLTDRQRQLKQLPRRRGLFPSIEGLQASQGADREG